MESTKVLYLDRSRAAARCPYRKTPASRRAVRVAQLLSLTELIVTALIGIGFCFCLGLVISML